MKSYLLIPALLFTAALTSCMKETNDTDISDTQLASLSTSEQNEIIRTVQSGDENWNIRMNEVASKAYAEGSKSYPANSMIIKEKHDGTGRICGYDVMYKSPSQKDAANGWVYMRVANDGHVTVPTADKGASCQSCHAGDARK